jgi:hypothetical protein
MVDAKRATEPHGGAGRHIARSTLQKLRLLAIIVLASAVPGACCGLSQDGSATALWRLFAGTVIGAFISSAIFGMELFAFDHWVRLSRLPQSVVAPLRAVAYGCVIVVVMLFFPWLFFDSPLTVTREGFARSVMSAAWVMALLVAAMTVVQLIGPEVLGRLLVGRYYRPREAQRIVMFLDLADSTGSQSGWAIFAPTRCLPTCSRAFLRSGRRRARY